MLVALKDMWHRILLGGAFLYLTISNLVWIVRDTRPPFWDMAAHQSGALRILNAFRDEGFGAFVQVPELSGLYPPLYHSIVAGFYYVFGVATDSAQVANLLATAILMAATYGIGTHLLTPTAAAMAAALTAFYPMLLWLSRESMIDYWLTAMVALAMWTLIESDGFRKPKMSLLYGAVCGLGMLTKGTFALFLVLPTLWFAHTRWKQALPAGGIAAMIASYWYVPQARALIELLRINTAGSVAEGDPVRLGWQALVFYVRALEGYQLFGPLFLLFVAGAAWLAWNFKADWWPILLWILGGWGGLLLFQNKDPRYTVALLPAVALISVAVVQSRTVLLAALMPFLLFQHYLVSFGIRTLPETVIIAHGIEGPLTWNWNLYTQQYFDLWGPPAREDWKIAWVLDRIRPTPASDRVRLGIIPDIPRFDFQAFEFYAAAREDPVVVERLAQFDPGKLSGQDYLLVSESPREAPGADQPDIVRINQHVMDHPEEFEVLESFPLPNGETIRVYRVRSPV